MSPVHPRIYAMTGLRIVQSASQWRSQELVTEGAKGNCSFLFRAPIFLRTAWPKITQKSCTKSLCTHLLCLRHCRKLSSPGLTSPDRELVRRRPTSMFLQREQPTFYTVMYELF